MNKIASQKGFTLIEMLLTLALFSFVVGAIALLPSLFREVFNKQSVVLDVTYAGDYIMDKIMYDLRSASEIGYPRRNETSETSVDISLPRGDYIKYELKDEGIVRCLNEDCVDLSDTGKIRVTSFLVSDLSNPSGGRALTVSLRIEHKSNELGKAEYRYSRTFNDAVFLFYNP